MGNTVTICFANNKGGSGKSTSCSNVGAALAGMGKKVLMVDGDMQLNLSLSFFSEEEVLEMAAGEKNLYYAIGHQSDLSDFIVHTKYENLDLVPSSTLMSSVEYELFTKWQREFILRKCLQKVKDSGVYDYILIDAPPTLGGCVMNILCASDYVLVPVEASPWGMFGLANMFDFLNEVREIAPDLLLLRCLLYLLTRFITSSANAMYSFALRLLFLNSTTGSLLSWDHSMELSTRIKDSKR